MTKQEQIDLEAKYGALLKEQKKNNIKLQTIRGLIRGLELLLNDCKPGECFCAEKGVAMRTLMFAIEDATLLPIPGFKY